MQATGADTTDDPLADLAEALFSVTRTVARHRGQGPLDRAAVAVLGRVVESGPVRMSDVASTLGFDLSSVSRQVQGLADAGHVTKTPDPTDRRATLVSATATGRAALDAVRADRAATLGRALADWPEKDRRSLTTLLVRLGRDLEEDAGGRP